MNKALQQRCSWLRSNGGRCSNRWIQGFSMCVTRTGKEGESPTFPSCDWESCAWWWAFNCPCHSSHAVLWPAHLRRQIVFPHRARSGCQLPPFGNEVLMSSPLFLSGGWHHLDITGRLCAVSQGWPSGPESQAPTWGRDLLPVPLLSHRGTFAGRLNKTIKLYKQRCSLVTPHDERAGFQTKATATRGGLCSSDRALMSMINRLW